jgi:hypothetical protein
LRAFGFARTAASSEKVRNLERSWVVSVVGTALIRIGYRDSVASEPTTTAFATEDVSILLKGGGKMVGAAA